MAVTLNGSDPTIYLTNGTRSVLGLEGESSQPESRVQAAQDSFYEQTGVWPYVEGMPNTATTPEAPATTGGGGGTDAVMQTKSKRK